jgi:hypothetical protein
MLLVLLFLAFRSGDRKTIFCERSSDYFLIAGLLWLGGNILVDYESAEEMFEKMAAYLVGTFGHPAYYCQLYNIAVIPLILFSGGLMLRRHELDLYQGETKHNTRLLKATGYCLLGGTAAFILYRMGVRVYELVRVLRGDAYNVRLAFTVMDVPYNRLIELPQELANSPEDYRHAVLFRFVKDFPVAVVAALAVYCFVKVLFAIAKGEINSAQNRKRLNIAILTLLGASLWFNGMGFAELPLFDNGFSGVFGEVTYTMATRSLTEPALYALALWFFKTYLQTVPEQKPEAAA